MRVLAAVVVIPTLARLDPWEHLALGPARARQLVGHDDAGNIGEALEELTKKLLGGLRMAPALDQDVEPMIVLVDSALEVMALAMHRQEDLVQVPLVGPDKASNWLPAPAGPCVLMLRVYWPHEQRPSMRNGSWTIPTVKKVS